MAQNDTPDLKAIVRRLRSLHLDLEAKSDHDFDWSHARALEDRIGAGQYLLSDIGEAQQLLDRYGF